MRANILPNLAAGNPTAYALQHYEALQLSQILIADAKDYLYSSIVCLADAIRGIQEEYFSWATVKLYYASFYALRGILAVNRYCLFHHGHKPRTLLAQAGETVAVFSGNRNATTTHGFVIEGFKRFFPNHPLLSQDIAGANPVDWLRAKREEANYKEARLFEPTIPSQMRLLSTSSIRKHLNAYIDDGAFCYAFDPDHAVLSFPVETVKALKSSYLQRSQQIFDSDEADFLKALFKDQNGIIPKAAALIE